MATEQPPKHLTAEGKRLWRSLFGQFVLDDAAGIALLRVAVEAFDRAQEARRMIKAEGAVLTDRFGQKKAHPACAIERDARGQFLAAIRALKLEPED
jgi:P27 family predicted phage terminase small subunit